MVYVSQYEVVRRLQNLITYDRNLTTLASEVNLSRSHVSSILAGNKHPNDALLKMIGIKPGRVIVYIENDE